MITFATKCWGGDFEKFLGDAFAKKENATDYLFDTEFLVLNNGVPLGIEDSIKQYCVSTSVHKQEILDFFRLSDLDFKGGINYALGELAAIWRCETEYLCFVQGDCITQGGDWITSAIRALESESDVLVVSPASEVNTWHNTKGYDHYMSDQAWVIRTADFKNPLVYQIRGLDKDYPDYGGNSFEHMVGKFLKKTGLKRKILTDFYVNHPTY